MTVVPNLIMVSYWLVLQINTGKLKIHGVQAGENKDTSDWLEVTHVVSAIQPHTPTNDCISSKYHHSRFCCL